MTQEFEPRPFQRELMDMVPIRIQQGYPATVGLIATGMGKTLAWMLVADRLLGEGLIDCVFVYAPRLTLCGQADEDWQTYENEFGWANLRRIGHVRNRAPLLPSDLGGFIATYASAVSSSDLHVKEAQRYKDRFLLVVDEGVFAAEDDQPSVGTRAGEVMKTMMSFAFHTMPLTATGNRQDGGEIVGCDYKEGKDGRRRLDWHVRARISDGVRLKHLRGFEFELYDGSAVLRSEDDSGEDEVRISLDGNRRLSKILESPEIWRPILDKAMARWEWCREQDPRYRLLVACMHQRQAREVMIYLERTYPKWSCVVAISEDGDRADKQLRAFRNGRGEVLVTVRKAFIGYDCKQITVTCMLTNYRWDDHLVQLSGRGLRWWPEGPDDQTAWLIGPDDPELRRFVEDLKEETDRGMGERQQDTVDRERTSPAESDWQVVHGEITDATHIGFHGDSALRGEELVQAEGIGRELGLSLPPTTIHAIRHASGRSEAPSPPPKVGDDRMTYEEELTEAKRRCSELQAKVGSRLNGGKPGQEEMKEAYRLANQKDGLGSSLSQLPHVQRRAATYEQLLREMP